MNRILLALAAAALTVGTAAAQKSVSPAHTKCHLKKVAIPERTPGDKTGTFSLGANATLKSPALADAEIKRDPKRLSYEVEGNETKKLKGTYIIKFETLKKYNYQVGYFQCFHKDVLRRFVGNRLGKIKFYAWYGKYSNARIVIWDDKSYNWETSKYEKALWQKDITITGHAINEVDCDLVIPDDEEFLDHGFSVVFYADVEADPDDPSEGSDWFRAVVYEDKAEVEHNSAVVSYSKTDGTYGYFEELTSRNLCPAIWLETEGEGGFNTEDVTTAATAKVRGVAGTQQNIEGSFYNLGTDSIYSVDYICENDGRTLSGTAQFDTPVKMFSEGTFHIDMPINATAGYHDTGKLTITKVNGKDDEYAADNTLTGAKVVALTEGYKRTPVLEEFTSTTCGWCPYGIVGMKKATEAVGGKAVPVAIHDDYSFYMSLVYGSDPLISPNYKKVAAEYATSYPSTFVNREVMSHAYNGIVDVVKAMAEKPCEASMTLTPTLTSDGVQLNTTLNFIVDVPADAYGLAYAVTEDNIENVKQYNIFASRYHTGVVSETPDPDMVAWFNNLDDELKPLATAESAVWDGEYSEETEYWTDFTMNHVACGIIDPMFEETYTDSTPLVLPAMKAGQDITRTFKASLPTREAVEGEIYTSPVPAVKPENLKYSVYLIDLESGIILTGCQAAIGETATSNEKVDLTTGIATTDNDSDADIRVAEGGFIVKANGAEARMYDALGRMLTSRAVDGEASLPVKGKGVYIVRVVKDGRTATMKAAF